MARSISASSTNELSAHYTGRRLLPHRGDILYGWRPGDKPLKQNRSRARWPSSHSSLRTARQISSILCTRTFDKLAIILIDHPRVNLSISGHTDSQGKGRIKSAGVTGTGAMLSKHILSTNSRYLPSADLILPCPANPCPILKLRCGWSIKKLAILSRGLRAWRAGYLPCRFQTRATETILLVCFEVCLAVAFHANISSMRKSIACNEQMAFDDEFSWQSSRAWAPALYPDRPADDTAHASWCGSLPACPSAASVSLKCR